MFRPLRRKARQISDEEAKRLLAEERRGVLAVMVMMDILSRCPSIIILIPLRTRYISMVRKKGIRLMPLSVVTKCVLR